MRNSRFFALFLLLCSVFTIFPRQGKMPHWDTAGDEVDNVGAIGSADEEERKQLEVINQPTANPVNSVKLQLGHVCSFCSY